MANIPEEELCQTQCVHHDAVDKVQAAYPQPPAVFRYGWTV